MTKEMELIASWANGTGYFALDDGWRLGGLHFDLGGSDGAATCLLFRCRSIGKKRCCELGLWRLRRVRCGGFGCESDGKTAALHVDRAWRSVLRQYKRNSKTRFTRSLLA